MRRSAHTRHRSADRLNPAAKLPNEALRRTSPAKLFFSEAGGIKPTFPSHLKQRLSFCLGISPTMNVKPPGPQTS